MMKRRTKVSTAEIRKLRKHIQQQHLHPYDHIRDTPVETSMNCAKQALSQQSYSLKGMVFSVKSAIDWKAENEPRSYRMYIQAWNFLEPFFVHYSKYEDEKSLTILHHHIDDWIEQFGHASAIQTDIANVVEKANHEGLFVGHTMAIAGRFYRLAYMIDIIARTQSVDDQQFWHYVEVLQWHASFMANDDYFLEKHNHGVQAALSQVIGMGRLLRLAPKQMWATGGGAMEELYAQGKRRLFQTLREHVCPDGTHKEHSPHYHMVVAHAIREPIRNGLVSDAIIKDIYSAMQGMAPFFFDFRGRVANIGDSDLELLAAGSENFKEDKWPQQVQSKLFPEGGYWFVKGTSEQGKQYLVHQAAMHSRTHKQADTGCFIWQDRGLDILVDTGRYGYVGRTKVGSDLFKDGFWYSDPRRVYVESTRAHNTLSVDGKNHPRYRVKPFGSAIKTVSEKNGVFVCESSIPSLAGMSHFRILVLKPGAWLLCVDTIRAADGKDHDFCQHFQLHPDWQKQQNDETTAHFQNEDGENLHVTSLFDGAKISEVARGKGKPDKDEASALSGWWSPRHLHLEPCTSLGIRAKGSYVTMATLFSFSPVEIDEEFSSFNITRRRLRFRWKDDDGMQTLVLDRDQDEDGKPTLVMN